MAGTKSQGTRVFYHATPATVPSAVAAGAYPSSPWVEVTRGVDTDLVPQTIEEFDGSCLNDTAKSPQVSIGPGTITFSREQDTLSTTLRGFCDGTTAKAWAVVYSDGQIDYAPGILVCTSAGKASKGFANKVTESYKVICSVGLTHVAAA